MFFHSGLFSSVKPGYDSETEYDSRAGTVSQRTVRTRTTVEMGVG